MYVLPAPVGVEWYLGAVLSRPALMAGEGEHLFVPVCHLCIFGEVFFVFVFVSLVFLPIF